ncbi:DUF4902 domain-containing protein [Lysobacter tyrosinilyticus]
MREGEPRSNVMLLDSHGRDLGAEKTSLLLEAAVDSFQWFRITREEWEGKRDGIVVFNSDAPSSPSNTSNGSPRRRMRSARSSSKAKSMPSLA